tara:strand:+ start:241 stop:522 length:282 start_codon:yes stop_codon:yes gene_type:complete
MKSYVQGLITGAVFVFSFMVLMGNQKPFSKTFKDKLMEVENRVGMIEGTVKEKFKIVGKNFLFLEDKTDIPLDLEYNYNCMSLINEPFYLFDK